MRRGCTYIDGFFPPGTNAVPAAAGMVIEEAELWDGETYWVDTTTSESSDYHHPSNSSTSLTKVCGPGTAWWLGLTLQQLAHTYWRVDQASMSVGGSFTATTGALTATADFPSGNYLTDERLAIRLNEGQPNDWYALLTTNAGLSSNLLFAKKSSFDPTHVTADAPEQFSGYDIGGSSVLPRLFRVETVSCSASYGLGSVFPDVRHCKADGKYYVAAGSLTLLAEGAKQLQYRGPRHPYWESSGTNIEESRRTDTLVSSITAITPPKFWTTGKGVSVLDHYRAGETYTASMEIETARANFIFGAGTAMQATIPIPLVVIKRRRHQVAEEVYTPPSGTGMNTVPGFYTALPLTYEDTDVLADFEGVLTVTLTPTKYFPWGGLYNTTTGERIPLEPPTP